MICADCEKHGKKSVEAFTQAERLQMLGANVSMLVSIKRGRNNQNDLMIANSVITKLLLSFDVPSRQSLINHFRTSLEMEITLNSCPHSKVIL